MHCISFLFIIILHTVFSKTTNDFILFLVCFFRLSALQYQVQRRPPKRKILLKIPAPRGLVFVALPSIRYNGLSAETEKSFVFKNSSISIPLLPWAKGEFLFFSHKRQSQEIWGQRDRMLTRWWGCGTMKMVWYFH